MIICEESDAALYQNLIEYDGLNAYLPVKYFDSLDKEKIIELDNISLDGLIPEKDSSIDLQDSEEPLERDDTESVKEDTIDLQDSEEPLERDDTESVKENKSITLCLNKNNKRYPCLYCDLMFSRLKDHLLAAHSDIQEVQALNGDKNAFILIRNKAVNKHNLQVFENGEGEIIVTRIGKNLDVFNYLPCEKCLGWFCKQELWRHKKTCIFHEEENEISSSLQAKKTVMKAAQKMSSGATEVLCTMWKDEIGK